MKTAVVTLSISHPHHDHWMAAGLPSKQAYARHIGEDFINITERKLGGSVASEKYQIGDLLEDYDRILYLDADLVIDPKAPNIFEVVPPDRFGIFDESTYLAPDGIRKKREALLAWLSKEWPDDPGEFYCNNGMFVCSREHRWLFDHDALAKSNAYAFEQTYMSRKVWEALRKEPRGIKVYWLPSSWNYMCRTWVGNSISPTTGWVPKPEPNPCWVHHFPCHSSLERAEAMETLNRRYGV